MSELERFAVFVGFGALALIAVLILTDNTQALSTCQATRSIDVCQSSLNP